MPPGRLPRPGVLRVFMESLRCRIAALAVDTTGMRVLIIGAGFAGAAAAYEFKHRYSADVTVIEQARHAGGMLRTFSTKEGISYEYGPRIVSVFRGSEDCLQFFEKFLDLQPRDIYQGTCLRPEYPAVPFPVDRPSLLKLPCGDQIAREWEALKGKPAIETNLKTYLESTVGPTLTALAFAPFNAKFWGRRLEDIPADWGKLRRLERISEKGEYRLPSIAPHYYPKGGFNPLFDKLLASANEIRYGVSVQDIRQTPGGGVTVRTDREEMHADLVLSTAPIDKTLGLRFGELEWKGYRTEIEVINKPKLGYAPDGVPFSWLYTPYEDTQVCRTTDFGVIHHGNNYDQPSVLLKELPDNSVKMYPVWWEGEKFEKYLSEAAKIKGFIPIGRLGMYKYVTMDSTYGMVQRLCKGLSRYAEADHAGRLDCLKHVRGDWAN